jgi:protocatechuate 3,4-dioxygenase alpha subunit
VKRETPPSETPSQTLGPFFSQGLWRTRATFQLPELCSEERDLIGNVLVSAETVGERLRIEGRVFDGRGAPIDDALVEIWQADAAGHYAHPLDSPEHPGFHGFGRSPTDAAGQFFFETIKPGRVPAAGGGPQAPHLNVLLGARGLTRFAFTRIYFPEDELETDPVLARVPQARRHTLVARRAGSARPHVYLFDIRLQGDDETVFFDF